MDKAPDAFRTISEVADEIKVPQHVLRFWESRFAQIRPMKRGGGRRYYRPDDVDLLRGVRHLLYGEGYTIRGVQRILREEGISFVQEVWRSGSVAPPSELENDSVGDDGPEGETVRASEPEPSLFGNLPARSHEPAAQDRPSPRREPAVSAPPPKRLDLKSDDRQKLQAAVDDLVVCHRLIDAALSENYSDPVIANGGES